MAKSSRLEALVLAIQAFRMRAALLREQTRGRLTGESADLIREARDQR